MPLLPPAAPLPPVRAAPSSASSPLRAGGCARPSAAVSTAASPADQKSAPPPVSRPCGHNKAARVPPAQLSHCLLVELPNLTPLSEHRNHSAGINPDLGGSWELLAPPDLDLVQLAKTIHCDGHPLQQRKLQVPVSLKAEAKVAEREAVLDPGHAHPNRACCVLHVTLLLPLQRPF